MRETTKPKRPRKVWTNYLVTSKTIPTVFLLTLTSLLLTGCATSKESLFPHGGKTMKDIYEQQMAESHSEDIDAARNTITDKAISVEALNHDVTSTSINQDIDNVNQTFAQLPNPTLAMYVFPHLAGVDGAPVPGYVTAFSMYNQLHYALPGELPIS